MEWVERPVRVSFRQMKVKPMLGRVKKLLEQLFVPQKPVPMPVRVPRRIR
jgi:hypothetical protein